MNYQYLLDENAQINDDVIKQINDDSSVKFIPNDPKNTDWRAYQAWLALDNETLAG